MRSSRFSSKSPFSDRLKVYLDYLDKEMTIMGILSTFCILTLGYIAQKLVFPGNDITNDYWEKEPLYCFIGFSGLLLAALSFYRQRSLLAWYYGQLSLYQAQGELADVDDLLKNSDAWYNWCWYQAGFGFLSLAFLELGAALFSHACPFIAKQQYYISPILLLACTLWAGFMIIAYARFPYEEKPFTALRKSIFRR